MQHLCECRAQGDAPCAAPATQEDGLCDPCREAYRFHPEYRERPVPVSGRDPFPHPHYGQPPNGYYWEREPTLAEQAADRMER